MTSFFLVDLVVLVGSFFLVLVVDLVRFLVVDLVMFMGKYKVASQGYDRDCASYRPLDQFGELSSSLATCINQFMTRQVSYL